MLKEQNRRSDMYTARALFTQMYPLIANEHSFAGGSSTQTYIQMHASLRPALHAGVKNCTRRTWGHVKQEMQAKAYRERSLVAVTGQGHSSTMGYVLYTYMARSSVGVVLTADDLLAEGGTAKSDLEFRTRWYRRREEDVVTGKSGYVVLPDCTPVHVLNFTFFSLYAK